MSLKYFAFLSFLLFFYCTRDSLVHIQEKELQVNLDNKFVRLNDSVLLRIENFDEQIDSYSFICVHGSVCQRESHYYYYSPDYFVDYDTLFIMIRDENTVYHSSCKIKLFRQLIILKADDLTTDSKNWRKFTDYCIQNNIISSIGVIGNSLEDPTIEYLIYCEELLQSGWFEFWNHGYDHRTCFYNSDSVLCSEFQNTSYEYQKQHIERTNALMKEKIHVEPMIFGAPANKIDSVTRLVLSEIDPIKVWFYGDTLSDKMVLRRTSLIEFPVFFPVFQKFVAQYKEEDQLIVYQIHPSQWGEEQFNEFCGCIEFLKEKQVTFCTAKEYFESMVFE